MSKRIKIAITISLATVIVAGFILFLLQSQKPIRNHPKPSASTEFKENLSGPEFVGVGVAIRMDAQTHTVRVGGVVPNTPAAEAGLTNGLIVSKVDDVSLEGKSLEDCVNLIRGAVGTSVRLELVTPGTRQTNVVELTRRKIKA